MRKKVYLFKRLRAIDIAQKTSVFRTIIIDLTLRFTFFHQIHFICGISCTDFHEPRGIRDSRGNELWLLRTSKNIYKKKKIQNHEHVHEACYCAVGTDVFYERLNLLNTFSIKYYRIGRCHRFFVGTINQR